MDADHKYLVGALFAMGINVSMTYSLARSLYYYYIIQEERKKIKSAIKSNRDLTVKKAHKLAKKSRSKLKNTIVTGDVELMNKMLGEGEHSFTDHRKFSIWDKYMARPNDDIQPNANEFMLTYVKNHDKRYDII